MSLAALNDIDDAIEATKRFLTPVDRVRWFRLAVVMFFIGGIGFSFPTPPTGGFSPDTGDAPSEPVPGGPGPEITPEITPELIALAVGVAVVGLLLFLAFSILGATMEFVFVGSLRDEEVRLRRSVKRYWRKGVRLFGFQFGTWLLTAAVVAAGLLGVGTAMAGWPPTEWTTGTTFAVFLLGMVIFVVVAIFIGIVLGFTTLFVVPVMLREDRGVIGAWRRFWPTLRSGWTEFLAYLVINFLLTIAVGIAVSFLSLLLGIALAVPFLIVGVPLGLVLGISGAGGLLVLVLVVLYVILIFIGLLLIQVPFQTFLRYYALLVLGDVNSEFDVVPEARAAVRADGGDGSGDGGPNDGSRGGDGTSGTDGIGGASNDTATGVGQTDESTDSGDDVGWDVERDDEWGDRDDGY